MKKSLSPLAFGLLLLLACANPVADSPIPSTEPSQSRALASQPIRLVNGNTAHHYSYHGIGGPEYDYVYGKILVDNLAYAKSVTVHYTFDGLTWSDSSASYKASVPGNKEIWTYQVSGNFRSIRFALKYEVNGTTYWDNNGGKDYTINMWGYYIDPASNIVLNYASMYPDGTPEQTFAFYGTALVKNLAYAKKVSVVYTTDGWKTTKTAAATYNSAYPNNYEAWNFAVEKLSAEATVEFALSYDVNGTTYWDNNFGLNYKLAQFQSVSAY